MEHSENTRVKIPALVHLSRLGYKYLSLKEQKDNIDTDINLFKDIFRDSINRINGTNYTLVDTEKIINELKILLENDDLVDDEREIADLVEIYLVSDGYQVFKAASAQEGLDILKKEDIKPESRFIEDLGFTSFDFMSMLGEIEDEMDVEIDQEEVVNIRTVQEAVDYLSELV